ncbi:hypothetical protein [Luteibacter yeojuensis]
MRTSAVSRSRIEESSSLPQLLGGLANHFAAEGRTRGIALEFEIDPALAGDLHGPFPGLGRALSVLLEHALGARTTRVALHVDVVGDDAGTQIVHFTVADGHTLAAGGQTGLDDVSGIVASFGGVMHHEWDVDIGNRVIIELVLERPRLPPRIDVGALRSTLGGEQALREVIAALDQSLSSDLAGLHALLAEPGESHLQAWLHRVSGALGMAEATGLSCVGLALERDLAQGRSRLLDLAIGRFADDAGTVLEALRKQAGPMGYSSRP